MTLCIIKNPFSSTKPTSFNIAIPVKALPTLSWNFSFDKFIFRNFSSEGCLAIFSFYKKNFVNEFIKIKIPRYSLIVDKAVLAMPGYKWSGWAFFIYYIPISIFSIGGLF